MEAGAIAGIVLGSLVGLVVLLIAIVFAGIRWVKYDYNSKPLTRRNVVYIQQEPWPLNLINRNS